MKIIVGLGNPGDQFKNTRHNVGFTAVEMLAGTDASWKFNKKFKALTCEVGDKLFLKPETFMNNSGQAVSAVLSYYGLLPKKLGIFKEKGADLSECLYVIHDDLDIDLGKYKLALDSRAAGHRGVQSIIDYLKTQKFSRARIGVRNELRERMPAEKFVLGKFSAGEQEEIKKVLADLKI